MPIEAARVSWTHCAPTPLLWIQLREVVLQVVHTPIFALPSLALIALMATAPFGWRWRRRLVAALGLVVLATGLYSPLATTVLSSWLTHQLPPPLPAASTPRIAVLVGRGPQLATASTAKAAQLVQRQEVVGVYVSGDVFSTAQALLDQGVAPAQLAGDSCARTTWQNARLTALWLRQHHPNARVALITDPWQLPRATHAFARQGLAVDPIAVAPPLSPIERNRLALRETAATLLYQLQGRM